MINTDRHRAYIDSDVWKRRRQQFLNKFGPKKCFGCDEPWVDIHHLNYRGMNGTERDYDLVALCRTCHQDVHLYHTSSKGKTTIRQSTLAYLGLPQYIVFLHDENQYHMRHIPLDILLKAFNYTTINIRGEITRGKDYGLYKMIIGSVYCPKCHEAVGDDCISINKGDVMKDMHIDRLEFLNDVITHYQYKVVRPKHFKNGR